MGTHPQCAGFILEEGLDIVIGQAVGIMRVMPKVCKGIGIPVVPFKARTLGRYPQNASMIYEQCPHSVIVEASLVLVVVLVDLEGVSVIAIQPAEPRTKPHESLMVLGNRPHISVRESV